jgi:hypothetical protein
MCPTLQQKFDFFFEEEDSIEGMKKLIVEEVNLFRAEVRAAARSSQNRQCVFRFRGNTALSFLTEVFICLRRCPADI